MSSARYLELDSRFRDRNTWPMPSNFEVPISQTGTKIHSTALDPVSDAADMASWTAGRFSATPALPTISVNVESTTLPNIGASGDNTIIIMQAAAGQLQLLTDYYSRAILESGLDPTSRVRIISYTFLGTDGTFDRARFTVLGTFSTTAAVTTPGSSFIIKDPTDLLVPIPYLFIPGPSLGENILVNRVIYNITQDQSRPAGVYDRTTSMVNIITSGSSTNTRTQGPITWVNNDQYSIRTNTPSFATQLNGDPANNPSTKTAFNFPAPSNYPSDSLIGSFLEYLEPPPSIAYTATGGSTTTVVLAAPGVLPSPGPVTDTALNDFYVGASIRIITGGTPGEIRKIIRYNIVTNTVTVDPAFSSAILAGNTYSIIYPPSTYILEQNEARKITKWINYAATAIGGSGTTVVFPSSASNLNGYYSNIYIVMTSGAASGDIRLIRDYTVVTAGGVTTRTATIHTTFSGAVGAGDTFTITSGNTLPFNSSISQAIGGAVPQNFALLQFTKDNLVPFSYTGSLVSQQEMVCYEIELLNLILPNNTLGTAFGSLISFYQYVYVELQNVSASGSSLSNIIYSNNPNSTKMLFRCPIKDVPNPINSTFIKIDGNGMKQTIKFKPNDNLKFSVHMSTGELFETLIPEIFGPNEPDPITQISACFKMTRL